MDSNDLVYHCIRHFKDNDLRLRAAVLEMLQCYYKNDQELRECLLDEAGISLITERLEYAKDGEQGLEACYYYITGRTTMALMCLWLSSLKLKIIVEKLKEHCNV